MRIDCRTEQQRNGSFVYRVICSSSMWNIYQFVYLFTSACFDKDEHSIRFASTEWLHAMDSEILNHKFAERIYELQATRLSHAHAFEIEIWIIYRLLYSKIATLLNIYHHLSLKWSLCRKKRWRVKNQPVPNPSSFALIAATAAAAWANFGFLYPPAAVAAQKSRFINTLKWKLKIFLENKNKRPTKRILGISKRKIRNKTQINFFLDIPKSNAMQAY